MGVNKCLFRETKPNLPAVAFTTEVIWSFQERKIRSK